MGSWASALVVQEFKRNGALRIRSAKCCAQAALAVSEAALEASRAAVRDLKRGHASNKLLARGQPGPATGRADPAAHTSDSGDGGAGSGSADDGGWLQEHQGRCGRGCLAAVQHLLSCDGRQSSANALWSPG